jgi:hypothetical protein
MALAGMLLHRKWAASRLAAPALIALVPAICLMHPVRLFYAGLVGLAPFTLLARLLAP